MTKQRASLFAVCVLLLSACASTTPAPDKEPMPAPVTPPMAEPALPAPPPAPLQPDKSQLRLTLAAVGDMMIGTDYPNNHLPDDDGESFFAGVEAILSAADLTFGNLEGVLLDGGTPAKKCSNPSACYLFRSPTRYIEHFAGAGFDALSLANNHARDFGEEGRDSSMQTIAEAGLFHSGRDGDFASFDVNGLKVALLAYAVTKNSNMLLDYEQAFTTVAAHAATHDIVIVSFHGGAEGTSATHVPFEPEEYYDEPRGDVVFFARGVVDAGADVVLGHGPHVVRAIERYKDRLIAYSLGNFATYYGISVAGIKGVAPILTVTLDGKGRFLEGLITSTVQRRPDGPSIDTRQRALNLIRGLSLDDFGTPGIEFLSNGELRRVDRAEIELHELVIPTD